MAKKMTFDELQEYCARQIGIATNGHEVFLETLRKMVRESATSNKPLPTGTGVSRRARMGTATGAAIVEELIADQRIVPVQGRYLRLVPNEPEFLGEGK